MHCTVAFLLYRTYSNTKLDALVALAHASRENQWDVELAILGSGVHGGLAELGEARCVEREASHNCVRRRYSDHM